GVLSAPNPKSLTFADLIDTTGAKLRSLVATASTVAERQQQCVEFLRVILYQVIFTMAALERLGLHLSQPLERKHIMLYNFASYHFKSISNPALAYRVRGSDGNTNVAFLRHHMFSQVRAANIYTDAKNSNAGAWQLEFAPVTSDLKTE